MGRENRSSLTHDTAIPRQPNTQETSHHIRNSIQKPTEESQNSIQPALKESYNPKKITHQTYQHTV